MVVHYADYYRDHDKLPERFKGAYGFTGDEPIWSEAELRALRQMINDDGLELEALENFNPGFWYDILLDGRRKREQMENLKQLIRNVGQAGIEGETDLIRVLRILRHNGYQGVITPDHSPSLSSAAPWHTGFAYALGYIKAALTLIESE